MSSWAPLGNSSNSSRKSRFQAPLTSLMFPCSAELLNGLALNSFELVVLTPPKLNVVFAQSYLASPNYRENKVTNR